MRDESVSPRMNPGLKQRVVMKRVAPGEPDYFHPNSVCPFSEHWALKRATSASRYSPRRRKDLRGCSSGGRILCFEKREPRSATPMPMLPNKGRQWRQTLCYSQRGRGLVDSPLLLGSRIGML